VAQSAISAPEPGSRPEAEFFRSPSSIAQRRYEALRAHLYEGLSQAETAERFGYSPATIASLARDFRSGHLVFFPPEVARRRRSPAKERARARIVELRQIGHSVDDIAAVLKTEGMALNRTGISEVLAEEGFGRLRMRPFRERILPRRGILPTAKLLDFATLPQVSDTLAAGLFLAIGGPGRPGPSRPGQSRRVPRHHSDPGGQLHPVPAGGEDGGDAPGLARR
jgi:transposase